MYCNVKNEYSVNESSLRAINKKDFVRYTNKLKRFNGENFRDVSTLYDGLVSDVKYFPVPKSTKGTASVNSLQIGGGLTGATGVMQAVTEFTRELILCA